jgi:PAS domain S-box-containing protein
MTDLILKENRLLKKKNVSLIQELNSTIKKGVILNEKKDKMIAVLVFNNKLLESQNKEKIKLATRLVSLNKELVFQNQDKKQQISSFTSSIKKLSMENSKKVKNINELRVSNYARSLIEASRDPLFTINTKGEITDMNDASINAIGLTRKQLLGTDFSMYFTNPEKAKNGFLEIFNKGFISDFPLTITDHKLTDVLFNGSIYKDEYGTVIGIVLVARDITELKKNQKELTESKKFTELALEVTEEAKSKAECAQIVAENALKAKQQFLSNMSHEIRTPLNAIIGFTKVLLKTNITDNQLEYLNAIKISGDALIVLINDILDLAKVDAGKMIFEKTPFKMKSSIDAMMHLFQTKVLEKNISLKKVYDERIPEELIGDPIRLHQIILNLLSNAIKFTQTGNILVETSLLKNDENHVVVCFSVSDTGIGISAEKMDFIFENFQQATTETSRLYGGTGLGLAIVKQLVESQNGKIEVKSKLGKGSIFKISLPFEKVTETFETKISTLFEIEKKMHNIKVLVVEDIPLNQLLIKTLLDDFGFEKDIASNGKIALEFLAKNKYDIILMDLQMPEMNGFETTDYIRNVLKLDIPIIALTADVMTVDYNKCKEIGMNDYIAKPLDESALFDKICTLIKNKKNDKKIKLHSFEKYKFINLEYLNSRTKSNPKLMLEMISLYLNQTPNLILEMKKSLDKKDWNSLQATAHKMIPSFSIVGMSNDFENMAKQVQEYANSQQQTENIEELVRELEQACNQACEELESELVKIKQNQRKNE